MSGPSNLPGSPRKAARQGSLAYPSYAAPGSSPIKIARDSSKLGSSGSSSTTCAMSSSPATSVHPESYAYTHAYPHSRTPRATGSVVPKKPFAHAVPTNALLANQSDRSSSPAALPGHSLVTPSRSANLAGKSHVLNSDASTTRDSGVGDSGRVLAPDSTRPRTRLNRNVGVDQGPSLEDEDSSEFFGLHKLPSCCIADEASVEAQQKKARVEGEQPTLEQGKEPTYLLLASRDHSLVIGRVALMQPDGTVSQGHDETARLGDIEPPALPSRSNVGSKPVLSIGIPPHADAGKHVSRTHAVIEYISEANKDASTQWKECRSTKMAAAAAAAAEAAEEVDKKRSRTQSEEGSIVAPPRETGVWVVRILGQNGLFVDGKRRRSGQVFRMNPVIVSKEDAQALKDYQQQEKADSHQPAIDVSTATELDFFGVKMRFAVLLPTSSALVDTDRVTKGLPSKHSAFLPSSSPGAELRGSASNNGPPTSSPTAIAARSMALRSIQPQSPTKKYWGDLPSVRSKADILEEKLRREALTGKSSALSTSSSKLGSRTSMRNGLMTPLTSSSPLRSMAQRKITNSDSPRKVVSVSKRVVPIYPSPTKKARGEKPTVRVYPSPLNKDKLDQGVVPDSCGEESSPETKPPKQAVALGAQERSSPTAARGASALGNLEKRGVKRLDRDDGAPEEEDEEGSEEDSDETEDEDSADEYVQRARSARKAAAPSASGRAHEQRHASSRRTVSHPRCVAETQMDVSEEEEDGEEESSDADEGSSADEKEKQEEEDDDDDLTPPPPSPSPRKRSISRSAKSGKKGAKGSSPTDSQVRMPPPPVPAALRRTSAAANSRSSPRASPAPPASAGDSIQASARQRACRAVHLLARTYDLEGLLAGVIVDHRTATIAASEAVRRVLSGNPQLLRGEAGARVPVLSPRKRLQISDQAANASSTSPINVADLVQGQVIELWENPSPGKLDKSKWSNIQRKAWTEHLLTLLRECRMFGSIDRAGRDASGNALEAWYYYDPDGDHDLDRAMNLRQFVKPIRGALKTLKPIVWNKRGSGRVETNETQPLAGTSDSGVWEETQPEERESTWDKVGDEDFVV